MLGYTQLVWSVTRGVDRSPQGSPKLWPQLEREEVRGPTSVAVPTSMTCTVSVETVKATPVRDPLGCGGTAWAQARRPHLYRPRGG
jgi:hypothetical protein